MFKLYINGKTNFKWISFVQSVFNDTGLSYVFESHFPICPQISDKTTIMSSIYSKMVFTFG